MIRMKVGGMILTGLAAFLVADKVVNTVNRAVENCCEASKWKGYYRCWSKGDAKGEPVPPGYSMTTRPEGVNGEVVYDPTGADHSMDNQPEPAQKHDSGDTVKAVCEAVKAVAEKAIDSLTKRSEELRGASEGQTEASESDISDPQVTDEDDPLGDAIDSIFREDGTDEEEEETDQNETVD